MRYKIDINTSASKATLHCELDLDDELRIRLAD